MKVDGRCLTFIFNWGGVFFFRFHVDLLKSMVQTSGSSVDRFFLAECLANYGLYSFFR